MASVVRLLGRDILFGNSVCVSVYMALESFRVKYPSSFDSTLSLSWSLQSLLTEPGGQNVLFTRQLVVQSVASKMGSLRPHPSPTVYSLFGPGKFLEFPAPHFPPL